MSENLILPPLLFRSVFPGYRGLQYIQYFFVFPVISLFFTCKKSKFSRPGLHMNSHANFTYSFPQLNIILRKTCQSSPPAACLFSYAVTKNCSICLQPPKLRCSNMPLFQLLISRSVFRPFGSLLA